MLLDLSSKNSDRGMEAQRHFNRTAVLMSMSQHQHDNDCSIANNPNPTETLPLSVQQMIDYMGVALLNNQGLLQHYRSNGSKNAMHCYEQARDKSISTYGDRHPLVAHAINGIAATLLSIQQSGSSTRIAAEPEPVSSSQHNNKSPVVVIGEGNPLNGNPLDYLNTSLSILLNPLQRERQRENMYTMRTCSPQQVDVAIATVRNTIGDIKFAQKEFETAYSFFENAYQIRKNALGVAHPDTVVSALNAGKCLHCLHKPDQALFYYDIFLKALLSFSPTNNYNILTEETILHIQSIAWAFHQERSFENANKFYDLSLKTARKVFGDDNGNGNTRL